MASQYILTMGGIDKAKRNVTRSWYVSDADAAAWLADPALATTEVFKFAAAFKNLSGLGSIYTQVTRRELPALANIPGSNYRGNAVNLIASASNGDISDTLRTSIPARVDANFPIVPGTVLVQTESGGSGYDPVAFPDWHAFVVGLEGMARTEEGGVVNDVTDAELND